MQCEDASDPLSCENITLKLMGEKSQTSSDIFFIFTSFPAYFIHNKHTIFHQAVSLSKDLPPEVRALEVFQLKTGGLYGGWDQSDHQAFLKVRHVLFPLVTKQHPVMNKVAVYE